MRGEASRRARGTELRVAVEGAMNEQGRTNTSNLWCGLLMLMCACGNVRSTEPEPDGGEMLPDSGEQSPDSGVSIAQLVKISGDGQVGTVGRALGVPLVVAVEDANHVGREGETVAFRAYDDLASVSIMSDRTDAQGRAQVLVTLGASAGDVMVEASTPNIAGTTPVVFALQSIAGPPASIAAVAGSENQSVTAGSQLARPFEVFVADEYGNAVAEQIISFTIASGGGSVTPTSATTDAMGRASTLLTTGTRAGPNIVNASAVALTGSSVTFTATGLPGAARQLVLISGTPQTGLVASSVMPLVVEVRDANGNPVGTGFGTNFAVTGGGGSISPLTAQTNAQGRAQATWTLGTAAGTNNNTATASASGLIGSPVTFTASATARPPELQKVSGDGQVAICDGTALPNPLVVRVADSYGNRYVGTSVTFVASGSACFETGGGCSLTHTTVSNSQGEAGVTYRTGIVPSGSTETQRIEARLSNGFTVVFTATVNGC